MPSLDVVLRLVRSEPSVLLLFSKSLSEIKVVFDEAFEVRAVPE